MYILPVTDDDSQIFRVSLDYETSISIIFPETQVLTNCPPIMDLYIAGYDTAYGIPLVPQSDLVRNLSTTGCIPQDFGSLVCIANKDGIVDRESLVNGSALLVYFSMLETAAMGLT